MEINVSTQYNAPNCKTCHPRPICTEILGSSAKKRYYGNLFHDDIRYNLTISKPDHIITCFYGRTGFYRASGVGEAVFVVIL